MPFRQTDPVDPAVPDPNYTFGAAPRPPYFTTIKEDVYAALLEYVGTSFFLLLAYGGTQAAQNAASVVERDMYISLCFGFSLLTSVWLFYRVTGGLFNPNVSLALLITGVIGPVRFVLYCIAQLLGGITAAAIVLALTPGPLASNTFLAPGVNRAQGVFIEMFITGALVLAVLMLAAEKHSSTPFAPIGIGLTLFVCHLWAVFYTGAGNNTARSFGPAVVTGFPYDGHWIYWLGPFLGSLLGSAFYTVLKHIKYWRLNPGQDTCDFRDSPADPVHHVKSAVRRSFSSASRGRSHSANEGDGQTSQLSEKPVTSHENNLAVPGEPSRGRRLNDSAV
ncbi:aquaporin-like protein [Trametes meyenii]|nr:aquaporin-like protein [Trametes meyenii]